MSRERVQVFHMRDTAAFTAFCRETEMAHPELRFGRVQMTEITRP